MSGGTAGEKTATAGRHPSVARFFECDCRTAQKNGFSPTASRLRFSWPHTTIAAMLGSCVACVLLLAGPAYALDPNKRITQYIHTSWRVRDGSAPTSAYSIAQTSDGFLWFIAGDMATFDGVRFTSWDGPPNGGSITKGASFGQIVNAFGDHAGGLWVFGLRGIVHLKGRVDHFSVRVGRASESSKL